MAPLQLERDPDVLAGYLSDASGVVGSAEALARPRTAEEVAELVRHCQERQIPLTLTAGRTSTTAAAVPEGGWLLSTERLTAIEHIGRDRATAQAGVRLGELQEAIEATGRLYPPDPTSRASCTLGASVSCNASGARSFRYGPTRGWVEALQVVLPCGALRDVGADDPIPADWPAPRWTEPSVKTAAGYFPAERLLDLFIGGEGTLGVITRATVRLTHRPEHTLGLLAWFEDRASAVAFARAVGRSARADLRGPVAPRCIEYADANCLALARHRLDTAPASARAAVFCEQEVGPNVGADAHLAAWLEVLEAHTALAGDTLVADDDASRARLHRWRHAIPAAINERQSRLGMPKVGTDLAVPDAALDTMLEAYESAPLPHALFGHVGDGHLHLNLLPSDADELARARAYASELAQRAVALGGTISAEHGVGKLKRTQLAWMVGPAVLRQFAALKTHLDPAWILCRGNVVDTSA